MESSSKKEEAGELILHTSRPERALKIHLLMLSSSPRQLPLVEHALLTCRPAHRIGYGTHKSS